MNPDIWYRHALGNALQSLALLAVMGGFLALLGWLLWGVDGIVWLLLASVLLLLNLPLILLSGLSIHWGAVLILMKLPKSERTVNLMRRPPPATAESIL